MNYEQEYGNIPLTVLLDAGFPTNSAWLKDGQRRLMEYVFDEYYKDDYLDAYERLLLDAIEKKSSLFMRRDEVEESWQFIDQLIHAIKEAEVELEKYNAGSWGPSSSDLLIANHGSKWNNDE